MTGIFPLYLRPSLISLSNICTEFLSVIEYRSLECLSFFLLICYLYREVPLACLNGDFVPSNLAKLTY